jgi:hypothetical protein
VLDFSTPDAFSSFQKIGEGFEKERSELEKVAIPSPSFSIPSPYI